MTTAIASWNLGDVPGMAPVAILTGVVSPSLTPSLPISFRTQSWLIEHPTSASPPSGTGVLAFVCPSSDAQSDSAPARLLASLNADIKNALRPFRQPRHGPLYCRAVLHNHTGKHRNAKVPEYWMSRSGRNNREASISWVYFGQQGVGSHLEPSLSGLNV
jgi:hypothetical protein